jgi:Na+/H+-dicarboxylate symporter
MIHRAVLKSPSTRMLLSLALGLVAGAGLAAADSPVLPLLTGIAQPVGALWLDALTMTIVPLVFGLLVTGVSAAAASASGGGVAGRALVWFAVLLLAAALAAAAGMSLLVHLWPPPPQVAALRAGAGTPLPAVASAADWLHGIIPANPIRAAADTAMTPLVVFALLFGFALTRIAPDLRDPAVRFFRAVVETMLVMVHWVLLAGIVGVFALAFVVGARMGAGAAGVLLHYVLSMVIVLAATIVMTYLIVVPVGRISPLAFQRAALPSQAVAVSTQSSLASLPAMIEGAEVLEVPESAAGIVLPLAVSLFRTATAGANVAVAVYVGHVNGIALGPHILVLGAFVAAVISVAAVGLPAQVLFFATIAPVCLAMGVPLAALPLLIAVETIPDIFRTLGNVTSDLAVTRIVGRPRFTSSGPPSS